MNMGGIDAWGILGIIIGSGGAGAVITAAVAAWRAAKATPVEIDGTRAKIQVDLVGAAGELIDQLQEQIAADRRQFDRRIAALVLAAAMAVVTLALPAAAQTGDAAGETITLESLATVAGAVAASGVIVAFAGVLVDLTSRAKRVLSAVVGLIVVLGATILSGVADVGALVLAVLTGMSAGLAASKLQEVGSEGLNHSVTRRTTSG